MGNSPRMGTVHVLGSKACHQVLLQKEENDVYVHHGMVDDLRYCLVRQMLQ